MRIKPATAFAILAAGALSFGMTFAGRAQAQEAGDLHVKAPDLPRAVKWLNSPPLSMEQLRGKVVLVDFWEYTCVNCIRTLPYLKAWQQKYKDKGLVIIGVHTPEFQFAKAEANVTRAAKEFGLTYPLMVDSDQLVWRAYGNQYWPAKYLIDTQGFVRYVHFGEGSYDLTESKIQQLLRAANPKVELPDITPPVRGEDVRGAVCYPMTPELYLGYERGRYNFTLGNREGYRPDKVVVYKDPGKAVQLDVFKHPREWKLYLNGAWKNTGEAMISTRLNDDGQDYVALPYMAIETNAVMKPEAGKPVRVWVTNDGLPVAQADKGADIKYDDSGKSYLVVDQPRMYNIIKNAKWGKRLLKLTPEDTGMGIYSFTFTSCELAKGEAAAKE